MALRMKGRSKSDFLAALRESLALVPGVHVTIGQPISHRIDHMLSGTRANLAVKIFGPDLQRLRQLAEQARGVLGGVRGTVVLTVEPQTEVPVLRVHFDRPALARHGLHVREVGYDLILAVNGCHPIAACKHAMSSQGIYRKTAEVFSRFLLPKFNVKYT